MLVARVQKVIVMRGSQWPHRGEAGLQWLAPYLTFLTERLKRRNQ